MQPHPKSLLIKTIYFYLVSLISLMMIVFSTADLVNLGLKTWVFTQADRADYYSMPCPVSVPVEGPGITEKGRAGMIKDCEAQRKYDLEMRAAQKQRDAVRDLAFLVVGVPLFAYHWSIIRRESREG